MYLKLLPLLLVTICVNAQKKREISFSTDYALISSKMGMVNEFLADTNYFNSYQYETYPTNTLSQTQGIGFEIGYQPLNFQDFSLGINYLFCGIKRVPALFIEDPINPSQTIIFTGEYRLKIDAYSILIGSRTYFNKLFHFEDKHSQIMQRLLVATEYKVGFGLSTYSQEITFMNPYTSYTVGNFYSSDINGRINLLVGYELNKGKIVSSINFKLGYLFFKTAEVKNKAYNTFNDPANPLSRPMKLDFSGLNFGIQLTLRK